MRKKLKKFLAVLVTASLCTGLAGCGGNAVSQPEGGQPEDKPKDEAKTEDAKGRFLESQVNLPSELAEIMSMGKLEDGSIMIAGFDPTGNYCKAVSSDMGENWQVDMLPDFSEAVSEMEILKDGTILAVVGYADNSELKVISKDGQVKSTSFRLPKGAGEQGGSVTTYEDTDDITIETEGEKDNTVNEQENVPEETDTLNEQQGTSEAENKDASEQEKIDIDNMIVQADIDGEGNLIIQDLYAKLCRIDTQTGELTELYNGEEDGLDFFGIAGERIYACTENGMKILSAKDGSQMPEDAVLNEVCQTAKGDLSGAMGAYPVVMAEGMEENSLVYGNHQGVFYHKENGSVSEQVINGELTSLGDTSMGLKQLLMWDEITYMLLACDSVGNSKLFKYVYDENASAVPEEQINIYTLKDSTILRKAVANFQSTHPDVYVKIEIGISENSGVTAEDAIKSLNTNILAGKGPDILILDGMPVNSYLEKGILADMSGILKQVEDSDGIFENIKQVYEKDGKVYALPSRFLLSVIEGSDDTVAAGESLTKLAEYAATIKQEGKALFYSRRLILETFYQADSGTWMQEDGRLDEGKIKTFLQAVKALYDLDGDVPDKMEQITVSLSLNPTDTEGFGSAGIAVIGRMMKQNEIAIGTLGDLYNLRDLLSIEAEIGGSYQMMGETFLPYMSAGIVKESEKKTSVQEFMLAFYGKELAKSVSGGYPINRSAYEELWKKEIDEPTDSSLAMSNEEGVIISYDMIPLTEEHKDKFTKEIESLKLAGIEDTTISDLVIEEGEKYLKDSQSLDEAVQNILQKVNLYLSE
ncbi:MAG: ABC transporter substrate-binding protein [Lachnospiraceae bacterium]|nr:ABC transporter substrate-binding protein [Lachnospiraceae bacterium]